MWVHFQEKEKYTSVGMLFFCNVKRGETCTRVLYTLTITIQNLATGLKGIVPITARDNKPPHLPNIKGISCQLRKPFWVLTDYLPWLPTQKQGKYINDIIGDL
jgi:hypothetical protein